jgi:FKBP-type peptidyl-prolyl cis-trans isomerase
VIKGWDEGFALLKVGSVAKLIIPSSLAYGTSGSSQGTVPIPANSILVFDVTLVSAV